MGAANIQLQDFRVKAVLLHQQPLLILPLAFLIKDPIELGLELLLRVLVLRRDGLVVALDRKVELLELVHFFDEDAFYFV